MAYQLTQQIEVLNPHSNIDLSYGPYTNKSIACKAIIKDMRKCGKTVLIGNDTDGYTEYWWKNGIEDEDLVIKGGNFTDADKQEFITELIPTIENLINQAIGEIENGTY